MMLTVAPGSTAPVGSLTLPRIRPKLPCADSAKEKSNTTRVVLNTHEIILRFDVTDVISPSYPNAAHDRGRQHCVILQVVKNLPAPNLTPREDAGVAAITTKEGKISDPSSLKYRYLPRGCGGRRDHN